LWTLNCAQRFWAMRQALIRKYKSIIKVIKMKKINQMIKALKPRLRITHVICRIICLFKGHNKVNNKCKRCHIQFGVPRMENPKKPP
jgi:uncharacterized membrane protein